MSQQSISFPKGNLSSVEVADVIPAQYVSFIIVTSNTHLLNCTHITEKHIYLVYIAVRETVVNGCLFNLIFVQKEAGRARVIQPYLGHIALSAFEHYWDEQALVFYIHSTDRTLAKQRFGKISTDARHKAATPAKIKAEFQAAGIYHFNPSIIPDETFPPSLVTHKEDAEVSNVVTLTETPTPAVVSQKKNKTRKASPLPGTSGTVAPTNRNPDVLSSGKEDGADLERNAVIAPSQETPHLQIFAPNSFQSILSTPRQILTKARKSVSTF
jgi:hypothetical protein